MPIITLENVISSVKNLSLHDETCQDVIELILADKIIELIIEGCGQYDLDPPEWVTKAADAIEAMTMNRIKADLERRLKELEARDEDLKTKAERRQDVKDEIESLRQQLAGRR